MPLKRKKKSTTRSVSKILVKTEGNFSVKALRGLSHFTQGCQTWSPMETKGRDIASNTLTKEYSVNESLQSQHLRTKPQCYFKIMAHAHFLSPKLTQRSSFLPRIPAGENKFQSTNRGN